MGLLAGDEHASPGQTGHGSSVDEDSLSLSDDSGFESTVGGDAEMKAPLTREDKKAMALLIVLYIIQGVPIGLAMETLPFLLRERLSYSKIAIFSLSSYPYSLKLLWSPIVDARFFPSVGRRRSWIIPMQTLLGSLMLWMSFSVQAWVDDAAHRIYALTVIFTILVVIAATQDIAVDGWSLTLLSRENLSYASTCQTVGITIGWLMSFTVFLALNSEAFSKKWGTPILTLGAYLRFCSIASFGATLWLIFFQKERSEVLSKDETSITSVYKSIWRVSRLKSVQSFLVLHLVSKVGFAADDAATSLKMVEKGLGKEDFAMAVLLDFPIQIVFGYFIARWSRGDRPLRPWIWAFWPRLLFAFLAAVVLWKFPAPPITASFFAFLIVFRSLGEMPRSVRCWDDVRSNFCRSTTQFVCSGSFHARVSDPGIGGTYITLLNTVSNLGSTWPRFFVLRGIDYFTIATCVANSDSTSLAANGAECVSEEGKALCSAAAGKCVMERDGYYITTGICLVVGLLFIVGHIVPTAKRLQALPLTMWRVAR
ncbi:acetyl-coenzyme A transporter 1-domain-containing protein [Russula earlei]|uniref:Acetyl-coenzyme A transporter 1-domain-containing protein n=1 Tax=Russula earlei TaxID=71964 RepID=A0ACC0U609_9AGAM|nr:acetyl-coenzyme A transporter 1-domain-containing protein [Russula earlei]